MFVVVIGFSLVGSRTVDVALDALRLGAAGVTVDEASFLVLSSTGTNSLPTETISLPTVSVVSETVSIVSVTGTIFLAAFGYMAGTLMGKRRANTAHHRGTLVEEARRTRVRAGDISLAGIPVPPLDETKHFKLIGTTGTGKSTAIRELLGAVIARGDSVVVPPRMTRVTLFRTGIAVPWCNVQKFVITYAVAPALEKT